jgi:cytochrome c-type biogenesis protein CcmF
MLRVWNLSLIISTFCLTILGTFLTRSGVINSVHAFTQSDIGPFLLVFLALCAAVGIGLIAWRGDRLRSPGRIDSPVSRESAFLVNNLLFAGLALVVLLGTVYPLLAEALQNKQVSVGEPYFDRMTTPIGIALLFLMAVAPALPWRTTGADVLRKRLLVPAWVGVLTMLGALVAGARGFAELVTYGLAAFALAGIVRQFYVGARARRVAQREAWPRATVGAVRSNPRLYGGLVVHVGIVLIAVAIATTGAYSTKTEVRLTKGESATVSGYSFTYLGSETHRSAQKTSIEANVRVARGDHDLGVFKPGIATFPNFNGGIGTPAVHTSIARDIYLTLVSSPNQKGRVTIGVAIKPMMVWLWIGGIVLALGTLLALTPSLRRKRKPGAPAVEAPPVEDVDVEEVLAPSGTSAFSARKTAYRAVQRAKNAEGTT